MKDKMGREYSKVKTTKAGNKVITDGGFTCMKKNVIKKVKEDNGRLFISCKSGKHFLDGQLSTRGESYIGLYPVNK